LSHEEITQILKLIDESDFDELQLQKGSFRLIVRKKGTASVKWEKDEAHGDKASPPATRRASASVAPEGNAQAPEPAEWGRQGAPLGAPTPPEAEGLVSIKAPTLGIFYRAPKPGAPPFVEGGGYVTEDDTVCLIEVMKLFNAVKAGLRGRVVKVCAENAQMVEYQQTLFLIESESPPVESCQ
jgi:acetyl-CoA carboxylase biotin carboxyl carrier protein